MRNRSLRKSKKTSKRDREKLRAIFESSPDAITVTDLKGRIIECNQATLELHGYSSKDELIGEDAFKLIAKKDHKKAMENLKKTLKQGSVKNVEYTFLRKDGQNFPAELSASVVKNSSGNSTGFVAITKNIIERKHMEEALKKSEEKFRGIFESANDCIVFLDESGKILNVNRKAVEVFGGLKEELLGRHFTQVGVFYHKDIPKIINSFRKGLAGKKTIINICIKNKRGRQIHLECAGSLIEMDGRVVGKMVIARDITARKDAERIRAHAHAREIMEERLCALDFYGRKLNAANSLQEAYELTLDAMEQTLGFEHAAFLKIDKDNLRVECQRGYPSPLFLELPLDGTKKGVTVRVANTRNPVLVPDTRKDKDYVQGVPGIRSELAVPVEIEGKVLGVLNVENRKLGAFDEKDVTLLQTLASHAATAISNLEKRREIEKRSNQLALLMKSSTKIISSTDLRQRLQTIAEAIRELGWRRVVLSVRDGKMEITNPEDIVTAGLTEKEIKFLWKNKPHGEVWQERFGPDYERFKIGEFYYLPWSDPWVRRKFSDGTIPSKLSPQEMVDWDPQDLLYAPLHLADGRIVGILSVDDPLDGRRPTEESLAPLELFIHQAAVAIENAQLIQRLNEAKEQLKADAEQLELKVDRRTQELRKSQEKLLKAQRLAAIGELAGMVGHDLRNPLTGIAGATYYLKSKLASKADKKSREMLELIEKDIEYSNKIVNDLLEYSGELQLELTKVSPKLVMKEALSLVKIPENITIFDSTSNKPKIRIDAQKMKRVFVNIIKNSIDAMSEGGKLTITSKETNGNLEIAFTDTGTGMSKNIQEKLWTPLFTTKAKGMGLGLPICKRIVEAHEGNISARSTVSKGTTFTVIIPIRSKLKGGEKIWMKTPESLLLTTTKA
jgi:PAS domain S-box-containing protein